MEGGIGETGKIIVDHANSNQLFGFNPLDANNFVMQSPNAGATWTNVFPAALLNSSFLTIYNQSKGYGFAYLSQKAFAMDPSNSARLLVIADRVYETTNSGGTWLQISGVLSQDSSNPFVAAIAIAPSDSNTLYASTQDGRLWVTHNDGTQWTESDSGLSGIVVDLRIDPVVPNHVFAITPRHNNTSAAVWHLPSSGLPWVNITGSIPNNLNFYSIFVDWEPATPTLFVGTDRGLYLSLDLGASWTKLGLGLPNTRINDIQGEIVGGKMVLAVATFGRGAWETLFRCLRPAESWAVSWGPGRLDVFGAGENNELLQRSWTTPGPPPAPLGGTLGMIYPSAVSWDTGRLDVFGVGENRDLLWWSSFNGIWAPGPVSLGGTLGSLFPSAVSWGPGRLDVLGVGLNNELLHWWFDGTWTGHTESLDSGMWTNSKPTVVSWGPRRLDVFGVGFNHELLHRWYDGTTWWPPGGPESVTALVGGTLLFSTSQSAVSSNAGQLDVFGVGENNELLYWSFNGTWRAPVSFDSGMWTCSKPSVVSWCSGRLDVFGEGENNVLLHRWFDGTGWNGPESLGGTLLTGAAPAAVSSNAGQLDVFGLGQNHDLLQWSFNGTTWTGPVSLDPGRWRSDVD
jgi:hypothetical protein